MKQKAVLFASISVLAILLFLFFSQFLKQKPNDVIDEIKTKSLQEMQLEYLIGSSSSVVISKVLISKSNTGYKMFIYPAKTDELLEYPLEDSMVESFTERFDYMLSKVKPTLKDSPVHSPIWEMKIEFTNSEKMTLMDNGPLWIDREIYGFEDDYDYNRDPVKYITDFAQGMVDPSTEIQDLQNKITILQNQNNQLQQQINELQGIPSNNVSQDENETTMDSNKCNVNPDASGKCPEGCVNYGVPLGCVTQEYYDECTKGGRPCPKCLSRNTVIATPNGEVYVEELKAGMPVWTVDKNGKRVAQPILKVTASLVPDDHEVVHIILKNDRELWVSPGHPTIDGGTVEKLQIGHSYDGSIVTNVILEKYQEQKTYDLLPAGETGYYWANEILMDSTLNNR